MNNDNSVLPISRSMVLALILTFISVLYYGYYSYSIGDYMIYSQGAVRSLYPENFVKDSYIQSMNDVHPTFTRILIILFHYTSDIISPFIIFVISKFLIFLGVILLARRVIKKRALHIFFLVFLFPYAYFGLTNSSFTLSFPFAVPRMISWGFFLIGFHFFLSKRHMATSILWGISSLMHIQFLFLTFPLLFFGIIYFKPKIRNFFNYLFPLIILIALASSEIISIYHNLPMQNSLSNKDYYYIFVEKLFPSNLNPKFYILNRGDMFFLLSLPLLFWKKVQMSQEVKRIWISSIIIIFIGSLISIFFTTVFFVKNIMWVWYVGFTPFMTMTSIIFLIGLLTQQWENKNQYGYLNKMKDILFIYFYMYLPYLGFLFFIIKRMFYNLDVKRFVFRKIAFNGLLLLIFFLLAPWSFGYKHHYYVRPWSGINFSMPEVIYFIRNSTPKDSLFMVPPVIWFMQPHALRSTVADYSHPGPNSYFLEWKKRMDEITGIDIFEREGKDLNFLYAARSIQDITSINSKYKTDYYMTFNNTKLKEKFKKDKNFLLVYWDSEYLIYKILNNDS